MALMKIESQNPDLSFVIAKNPESGMQMRSLRQGVVAGWFHNESYYMYFKDSPDELSFKETPDASYEYLSTEKYIAPVVYISMINMMLSSALKTVSDKDIVTKHKFTMMCRIEVTRYVDFFNKAYPSAKITFDEKVKDVGILTVETENTFYFALNHLMTFLMFTALITDNKDMSFNHIDDNQIEKYLKSIQAIGEVYFPMYLFKKNMIKSPKKFYDVWKPRIDTESMSFQFGDTLTDRKSFVEKNIHYMTHILDIGCGEGTFVFAHAPKLKDDFIYHAIDIDPEVLGVVERKMKHRELDNIALYNDIGEYESEDEVVVLMIEVIEHMTLEQAQELIQGVLSTVNFSKILITTPNKEFNQFYGMSEDAIRHPDHKYELRHMEFVNFMNSLTSNFRVDLEFCGIGDVVDGIQPTSTCIITKKGE